MFHPANSDDADLLAEWRWLLGGRPCFRGWSAAGDLFYSDEHRRIWRIDTGGGESEFVADSDYAFEQLLADARQAEDLLLLPVVRAFEALHGPVGEGRCLGFTTLPVFGGSYTVENRYAISVAEHAAFTGDLHRQIRDLPDGTAIQLKDLRELAVPPGNRSEALAGPRRGQHSIRINHQYRVCFRWEAGYADEVEVTDYH